MGVKLCLVCSSGGHFMEMMAIRKFWAGHDRFWVTFPTKDTKSLLKEEKRYWAYFPTNRSIKNFFRNLYLAVKILVKERPQVVVSTGAAVGVPFIYVGKVLGLTTIYVESLTRVEGLSLSGKLLYPFVDHLLVQWPEVAARYPKARYEGRVV